MIARAFYVLAVPFGFMAVASWATGFLFDAGVAAAISGFLVVAGGFFDRLDRDRMRRYRQQVWERRIRETNWDAEYEALCDEEAA